MTLGLALGGCEPAEKPRPIDPKTSADEAATRAADVVRQTGASIGFVGEEGGVLQTLFSGADDATSGIMGKTLQPPMPLPLIRQMQGTPALKAMAGVQPIQSLLTAEEQFDETARDVEVLLRDRLLVMSNIESKTDIEVTYLLQPDPTCRPLPSAVSGGRSPEPDPDCVRDLPKLQVRLVTRSDGDGARITVLLGPDRFELSAFVVHSDLLAWEIDFAKALSAAKFANTTLQPNEPQPMYPFTKLQGRVKFALQKLGPKKVKGSFGVLEAIAVQADDPDSGPISVSTAKSDPLFALTGDGITKEVTVKLAVAQTDVKTKWDPKDTGAKNSDLHVSIAGIHGEATLTEAKKEVLVRGLGIGPTFVAVRGTHIFDLNLNPNDGAKFDLKVLVTADDRPRFEVTPKFDLSLKFNLGAIASDFTEPPPAFLSNETYSIRLDGASPAVLEAVAENLAANFQGGLKVVAGSLSLATTGTPPTTVTVPAGKCLTGKEPDAMGSHEILGALDVVTCP